MKYFWRALFYVCRWRGYGLSIGRNEDFCLMIWKYHVPLEDSKQ